MSLRPFLAACLIVPLLLDAAAGQRRSQRTAEAALAAFAKVEGKNEAARSKVVFRLRPFADANVTKTLLRELERATTTTYRRSVVDALGGVKRDGIVAPLVEFLTPAQTSGGVIYSVARALAKQGDDGIAVLARALADDDRKNAIVQTASLSGLSQAGTAAAWDAIADFAADAPAAQRTRALSYLSRAELTPKVRAVLVAGVADSNPTIAVRCLRPLAAGDWDKTKPAVLRLHKKLRNGTAFVRAELLHAMTHVLDADLCQPFLEHISVNEPAMERAFDELADAAAKVPVFVAWLMRRGIKQKSILERCASLRILRRAEDPGVTDILLQSAKTRRPEIVLTALRCLGERGDRAAVPTLRKLLRAPGDARRIEALFSLHAILKNEKGWGDELLPLLKSRDRELRTAALDVLADLGSVAGLEYVWGDLDHKQWPVRAAAYDYCRKVRRTASIPKLIPRVDAETGRLHEDVLDTLQSLTGYRFPTTVKWRAFWEPVAASFELIPADALEKKPKRSAGATVTYYNIPLISDHVCFVVDRSGSMSATIGTAKNRTRLDEAKRQLRRVVEGMPKKNRFNVIYFDTRVAGLFDELEPGTRKNKSRAIEFVEDTEATGGTNIHDAMESAFTDESIDTIYLLSDGYPSAGKIQDSKALADEIARWNRIRQIRIHCIAIGSKSPLLERISKESGGAYAHVQ